jgi:hypothetical protein
MKDMVTAIFTNEQNGFEELQYKGDDLLLNLAHESFYEFMHSSIELDEEMQNLLSIINRR